MYYFAKKTTKTTLHYRIDLKRRARILSFFVLWNTPALLCKHTLMRVWRVQEANQFFLNASTSAAFTINLFTYRYAPWSVERLVQMSIAGAGGVCDRVAGVSVLALVLVGVHPSPVCRRHSANATKMPVLLLLPSWFATPSVWTIEGIRMQAYPPSPCEKTTVVLLRGRCGCDAVINNSKREKVTIFIGSQYAILASTSNNSEVRRAAGTSKEMCVCDEGGRGLVSKRV